MKGKVEGVVRNNLETVSKIVVSRIFRVDTGIPGALEFPEI
jgi:hypothetical protein